jgi:hypothetical protein
MVENSGKTTGSGAFQPVNLPEPVTVQEDVDGLPKVIMSRPRHSVMSIEDRWRLDDEWWRAEPVSRMYYSVLLKSGMKRVLFKDLIGGKWYRQS